MAKAKNTRVTAGTLENFCIHFPHVSLENTADHYGLDIKEVNEMLGDDKFKNYFPQSTTTNKVETAAKAEPKKTNRKTKL